MVGIKAKPLLEAEAKKNQQAAGKKFGKGIASLKNEKSYQKPINVEKSVAKIILQNAWPDLRMVPC